MYTSMMLVALSGFAVAADAEATSTWQTDYVQAKKMAQADKKPMAVFVGTGKNGWTKVARDGKLGKEMERVLTEKYVPVYIDSSTDAGKRLSSALGLESGLGLVISDSSGQLMAFHHEGDLFNSTLSTYLTRFSDPDRVVNQTVTNPGPGGHGAAPAPYYGPVPYNFGGGCANGRCR
ncbi:MAG: hypothetical protein K2R98_16600 [Gemmataceae bacterium]|nr:hypothetical protein [Gemmataceae bacterium]